MVAFDFFRRAALAAGIGLASLVATVAGAQHFMVGAQKCADCHKAETAVWEASKHATSFKDIHRKPEVKDIIAEIGRASCRERVYGLV